ncbi:MAG: sugar kinase, partial [Lachnospiraceae bacterium]|nr:sugar kinase [Lachnospiraceae bacterium]
MSEKKYDLLTLGEVLMRLSPERELRFSQCDGFAVDIGGAEANVAAGAAALGLRTSLITRLPAHAIGDMAARAIRKTGVDLSCVLWDEDPKARLGIYYYEKAASPRKPRVVYDRMHSSILSLRADDIPAEVYASTKIFHTSGITLGLSRTLRAEVTEMIRRFSAAGAKISFDVNYRSNLWSGPEAREAIEAILPLVDIFFCSKSTARLTFDRDGEIGDVLRGFAEDYDISVVAATHRIVHSPRKHSFTSFVYEKESGQLFTEE